MPLPLPPGGIRGAVRRAACQRQHISTVSSTKRVMITGKLNKENAVGQLVSRVSRTGVKFVMLGAARPCACDKCWHAGRLQKASAWLSLPPQSGVQTRASSAPGLRSRGRKDVFCGGGRRGGCSELGRWEVVFKGETDGK